MITKEEIIDFFKKHSIETIGEIMQEISEEIRKRWEKGAKKDSITNEELEKMMSGQKSSVPPMPPHLATVGFPMPSPPLSTQIDFGFPIGCEEKELKVGKVYYKDSGGRGWAKGGISPGQIGLTIIMADKAVSLRYGNVDKIEWMKNKKGGKKIKCSRQK